MAIAHSPTNSRILRLKKLKSSREKNKPPGCASPTAFYDLLTKSCYSNVSLSCSNSVLADFPSYNIRYTASAIGIEALIARFALCMQSAA